MNKSMLKTIALLAIGVSLTACGGGGGGGGTVTPQNYEPLSSTADVTSNLAGAVLLSADGTLSVEGVTGEAEHATQTFTTSQDGGLVISDLADGYDYVMVYSQSYTDGGEDFDASGVLGVDTASADIPTSGNHIYSGEATAAFVNNDSSYELSGQSTVTVNFEGGSVDVLMDEFITTDTLTGGNVNNPFTSINIENATISGNAFEGGEVGVSNGADEFNPTGANSSSDVLGYFFGYDTENGVPDEIGGVFLQQGDSGILTGGFVAD